MTLGCTDNMPVKTPPNRTPDSNVTKQINIEWNKTYVERGIAVINSSAYVSGFKINDYETISFNTTDGITHTCTLSIINTNVSPNMLDINGRPAHFSNLTIN